MSTAEKTPNLVFMIHQDKKFVSYIESRIQENSELYARFHLGTFVSGQALTVANALRRTLLAEVPGFVVTRIQIEGVNHEFATLPGIHESILNVLLNIKRMVLTYQNPKSTGTLFFPGETEFKAYISKRGPGIITANDIKFPPHILPLLSSHHIATLNSTGDFKSTLTIQAINPIQISEKRDFSAQHEPQELILDTIPKPVRQVNFGIHKVSTGQDQEYISLEIWTDGSINPKDALNYALEKLTRIFYTFTTLHKQTSYPLVEKDL